MIRKALALIVLLAAIAAAWTRLAKARDQLSRQRASIEEAWTSAEEAFRSRLTVLPEIAAAVKPETAGAIRSAADQGRQASTRAEILAASSTLDDAVARWLVEVEGAPPRPALDPLKERLREAEFRFANERRKYNSTLQSYNVALEMFPNNAVAWWYGFDRSDAYFVTEWPKSEQAR